MGLTHVEGGPGAPWEPPLRGRLDKIVVESEALGDNPLGDPHRRPLYVYTPPGHGEGSRRYPAIYMIQGFTGQLDAWLNRNAFEPNIFERVDELFSSVGARRSVVVFVDAWTSIGGSQFLNSPATGRYLEYLCDEVVPFVDANYATIADRDHRALTGKSSGGYGAMVVPMLRPDVFGAFASHCGDALFEVCYLPDFRVAARALRDHFDGSYEVFFRELRAADHLDFNRHGAALNVYAMAAAYSAEPDGTVLLPFEVDTGRIVPDVWERWLGWDPVRMASRYADALRSMRHIYIDAGDKDEFYLDLAARAFSAELNRIGAEHSFELFSGGHMGISYRYPHALAALAEALTP